MFQLFDRDADFDITYGCQLPHWFQPGATYFVTFRTEDSIPHDVAQRWRTERAAWLNQHQISVHDADWKSQLQRLPQKDRFTFHQTFSKAYLENLDKGFGACVLRDSKLSKVVAESLLHFDGARYHLACFVVMPNHVHLLVGLLGNTEIAAQCYSWKKFTAGKINRALKSRGRFWQEDSFDHLVRSPEQFEAIQRYIAENPTALNQGEYVLYESKK